MIVLKSGREIDLMRRGGQILADVMEMLRGFVKPGLSTLEIDEEVEGFIVARGAQPARMSRMRRPCCSSGRSGGTSGENARLSNGMVFSCGERVRLTRGDWSRRRPSAQFMKFLTSDSPHKPLLKRCNIPPETILSHSSDEIYL